MFCSLLGRKFSNKCKHSVKRIKCRMETIRKKKEAMVRYLKMVVADLISGGHETDAFGRMDALIVEVNQSSCYDMIEHYCCCIMEHLPTMQKERVCPEEAVEAIATLIFAAARFSDLPELADLRNEFTKRYGTQMEAYINEEFVEKMQKKAFPQDKKLQLMQIIAQEFSVHWDFKAFEHKISNPSVPTLDQPKTQFPSSIENIKYQLNDVQKKQQQLKPEELIKTENIKENQKTIQMRRRYEHHYHHHHHHHDSTKKINKAASDELEITQSHQFEAPQSTKTFNLNPPYVKPKLTKSASLDISNGGYYLMNTPFSIKRASTNAVSTVEDDNSFDQIPIKQEGTDPQIFVSMSSEQTEDDARNGAIHRRHRHRHLPRAFSNQPRLS